MNYFQQQSSQTTKYIIFVFQQDAPAPAPAPAAEAEADPPPKGGEVLESTMATAAVKTANDAARALCRKWEMTGTLTAEEEQTIVTEKTKVYDVSSSKRKVQQLLFHIEKEEEEEEEAQPEFGKEDYF